jgi:hypothetical protein
MTSEIEELENSVNINLLSKQNLMTNSSEESVADKERRTL